MEGAFANLFAEAAKLVGLPVANLKRDVQSVLTTIATETDNYLLQYYMDKALLNMGYQTNTGRFMDILYHALENDPEASDTIYNDMVKEDLLKTSTWTTEELYC